MRGDTDKNERRVAAAEFKANCLRPMDEVAQRRTPILITKRGKPVARLVPADEQSIDLFGDMAGTIRICGDIIGPTSEYKEWAGDRETSEEFLRYNRDVGGTRRAGPPCALTCPVR